MRTLLASLFLIAIALALCSAPAIACDDYPVEDSSSAAAADDQFVVVAEQRYQASRFTGPDASAQVFQLVSRPQRVFIAPRVFVPQRQIIVRPQRQIIVRPQRQVIVRPQRVFVRPQRVFIAPQRQIIVRPQRVFVAPQRIVVEQDPY